MNIAKDAEIIFIGGSAGSLPILQGIIKSLPDAFILPLVIVIHRQRNVVSELTKMLSDSNRNKRIIEPDDKEPIQKSAVYITPQNYHLLIEKDRTFSLDYSEAIKFSRPSIDVTFESAAAAFSKGAVAVLLSGANNDGTAGLNRVVAAGGTAVAQDPVTAEFPAMPLSAVNNVRDILVLDPAKIVELIISLNTNINKTPK